MQDHVGQAKETVGHDVVLRQLLSLEQNLLEYRHGVLQIRRDVIGPADLPQYVKGWDIELFGRKDHGDGVLVRALEYVDGLVVVTSISKSFGAFDGTLDGDLANLLSGWVQYMYACCVGLLWSCCTRCRCGRGCCRRRR